MKKFFGIMESMLNNRKISWLLVICMIASSLTIIWNSIDTYLFEKKDKLKRYDIVLDYDEIKEMASQSSESLEKWLIFFKDDIGIDKIGLKEESLNSLTENPKVPVEAQVAAEIFKNANWRESFPKGFLDEIEKRNLDKYDVIVSIYDDEINAPKRALEGIPFNSDDIYNEYAEKGETTDFVSRGIENRLEDKLYLKYVDGNKTFYWIDGNAGDALYSQKKAIITSKNKGFIQTKDIVSSKILYISLGFWADKMNLVKNLGFQVIPRTNSYSGFNGEKFEKSVIEEYDIYGIDPAYIIIGGQGIIGFDSEKRGKELIDFINRHSSKVAFIEDITQRGNIKQDGVIELAKKTADNRYVDGYNAVRVFTVWDFIQNRYQYYGYNGAEEIINTLFRTLTERDIRVIYFKPIKYKKDLDVYVTDKNIYLNVFKTLDERVGEHGFYRGEAEPFYYQGDIKGLNLADLVPKIAATMMMFMGLILLFAKTFDWNVIVQSRLSIFFGALSGILPMAAFSMNKVDLFIHLIGFGISVVFACLSILYFMNESKKSIDRLGGNVNVFKIILKGIEILVFAIIISLLGGLAIRAMFNGQKYFMEIDIFRGVKFAQILPLMFFPIAYLTYFGVGSSRVKDRNILKIEEIKALLNFNLKGWMIVVGAILTGLGAYYMMRTGHESNIEVSSTEMIFRNYLEEVLIARPRNKEFLFAFPSIMLMVYAVVKKMPVWTVIFGLSGVIGMTSINNTFMHIRTPLYLGVVRTGYSALFGIIIGIIAVLIFHLLMKLLKKVIIDGNNNV